MIVELVSGTARLGRGRRELRRAPPDRVQGLLGRPWTRHRSRTRPRSSASGRPRSARAARLRALARVPGDLDGARRLRHRAVRGRRPRVVHDGAEPRGRRRPQRRPRRHHVLLPGRLRRRRRVRGRPHAAMAIATGQCRRRGRVAGPQARRRRPAVRGPRCAAHRLEDNGQWSRPWGLLRPVDEIAMLTRRYMHEYGATRDHLANVALAFRKHANRNPAATMHERPLTREEYMDARWISEPLCLFDNCLETDGALAVVLVSAERAKDLPQNARVPPRRRAGPPAPAPDDDQLLQRRPAARARRGPRRSSCGSTPTSRPPT